MIFVHSKHANGIIHLVIRSVFLINRVIDSQQSIDNNRANALNN